MSSTPSYTIYFGGELFSSKHLFGNAVLAEAIFELSQGRYVPILPQNLEQREVTAQGVRDQDLRTLLDCDLGLFNYDGPELDSGTVVEFMVAKFADLPSVLLRTDFRKGGDQQDGSGDAWNLMSSFYPRTRVIQVDSMAIYKGHFSQNPETPEPATLLERKESRHAGQRMIAQIAGDVIAALDAVLFMPPVLPKPLAEHVYHWLALMPGLAGSSEKAAIRRFLFICTIMALYRKHCFRFLHAPASGAGIALRMRGLQQMPGPLRERFAEGKRAFRPRARRRELWQSRRAAERGPLSRWRGRARRGRGQSRIPPPRNARSIPGS
jgi:nucleoside 2-deoxyribosyltransferase